MTGRASILQGPLIGSRRGVFTPGGTEDAAAPAQKPLIGAPELVHRNPFYAVHRVPADFPAEHRDYYVSIDGPRAGTVLYDGSRVLLVRQYRLLIDDFSYEIPGGAMGESESPEDAAARECLEEAGVRCRHLAPLLRYELALDVRDNPTYLFVCADFERAAEADAQARVPGSETVGGRWFALAECLDMIFAGRICDSFTIIALLAFHAVQRRD
jgi:8-oxo-dGTP pyrophosphatase MutT (NUDIX family)